MEDLSKPTKRPYNQNPRAPKQKQNFEIILFNIKVFIWNIHINWYLIYS